MNLKDFLLSEGIKKNIFAEKVGISRVTLDNILRGRHSIKLSTAKAIEKASNGKVKISDLIQIETSTRRKNQTLLTE